MYQIVIEQGYDFDTSFQLEDTRTNSPLILTDASTTAQMRKHYGASTSVSLGSINYPDLGIISFLQTKQLFETRKICLDVKILNAGGREYKPKVCTNTRVNQARRILTIGLAQNVIRVLSNDQHHPQD